MPLFTSMNIRNAILSLLFHSDSPKDDQVLILGSDPNNLFLYPLPEDLPPIILLSMMDDVVPPLGQLEEQVRGLLKDALSKIPVIPLKRLCIVVIGGGSILKDRLEYSQWGKDLFQSRTSVFHVDQELDVWTANPDTVPAIERLLRGLKLIVRDDILPSISSEELEKIQQRSTEIITEIVGLARDSMPTYVVTRYLVMAIVSIYILQVLFSRDLNGSHQVTLMMGVLIGDLVTQGEYFRLLSYAFLHGNFAHVAVNVFSLLQMGRPLEILIGPYRFLVLYIVSVLGGALAMAWYDPSIPGVGASTGLWGVMTAMAVIAYRHPGLLPRAAAGPLRKALLFNIVINTAISFIPGISAPGHFGGGIAGALLIFSRLLLGKSRRRRADVASSAPMERLVPERRVMKSLGVLSVALMSVSVGIAFASGRPWRYSVAPSMTPVTLGDTRISLQLPVGMERHVEEQRTSSQYLSYRIGELARDPAHVRVVVIPIQGILEPTLQGEYLKAQASALGFRPDAELKILGNYSVLTEDSGRAITVREDWLIHLDLGWFKGLPEPWKQVNDQILASVAVEKQQSMDDSTVENLNDTAMLRLAAKRSLHESNFARAAELLERAMTLEPNAPGLMLEYARAMVGLERIDAAIQAYQQEIVRDGSSYDATQELVACYEQSGRYPEAADLIYQFLMREPDHLPARYLLVNVQLDARRYREALREVDRLLEVSEGDVDLLVLRGNAQLGVGYIDDAEESLKQALELNSSAGTRNNVAYMLANHGARLDWALELASSAVRDTLGSMEAVSTTKGAPSVLSRMAELAAYWDTLGTVYFKRNELERGEEFLRAAFWMSSSSEVGFHLGQLLEKQKRDEEALHIYAMSASSYPVYFPARERLSAMAEGDRGTRLLQQGRAQLEQMRNITFKPAIDSPFLSSSGTDVIVRVSAAEKTGAPTTSMAQFHEYQKSGVASLIPSTLELPVVFPPANSAGLLFRGEVHCGDGQTCYVHTASVDMAAKVSFFARSQAD